MSISPPSPPQFGGGIDPNLELARTCFAALQLNNDYLKRADNRQQESNEHLESIAQGLENLNEQMERLVEAAESHEPRTLVAYVYEWAVAAFVLIAAAHWYGVKLPL